MFNATTITQKAKIEKLFEYDEENEEHELPISWRLTSLNKLCESFDYGTSTKSQISGKVPVLRMGNIQNGKLDWKELVYTSDIFEIKKYSLSPNTVLFNRTNSPELVGKTAIYRGERPAIFAGYLIRINQLPELDPEYLNICLNSNFAKGFCLNVKTDGVSQSNINAQKLGSFELPFCQLREQQEIVGRVEELFALADRVEERYKKAQKRVDKLTQSILAKAFRGELVPQDPSDEPASVLLERIRAEKANKKVVTKRHEIRKSGK
jgi:type I restriction enzyme S subunit